MDEEIRTLVECVATELLGDYTFTVDNVLSKDGYLGDLIFVSIHGTTKDQVEKKIDIAVKVSKGPQFNISEECMESVFKQEIFFYDEAFPAFENIQKHLKHKFKPYPHCFKCFPNHNVIILEDLRAKGYQMLNKDAPMDFKHCKAVMEVFGQFHALSFALKNLDRQLFDKLAKCSRDLNRKHFESWKDNICNMYKTTMQEALDLLNEKGDVQLSRKMEKMVAMWEDKFHGYQDEDEPQVVLTHGDSWNNNMMFRYDHFCGIIIEKSVRDEELRETLSFINFLIPLCLLKDKGKNIAVKLIDWQLADVRTPIYDICLFLYSSCSDFKNFDQLIRIYHNSLTTFLKELCVDPEIFTFDDLQTHLMKYTPFMIIHLPFLLKFVFSDGILNVDEEKDEFAVGMPLHKKDLYHYRLKQAFEYYCVTYVK